MTHKNQSIKFVLISPYEEIHSCGVRALSSYLQRKGIEVKVIFCPIQSRFDVYLHHKMDASLPANIINDIARLSSGATCIGISLMTDHFNAVSALTKELKQRLGNIPILWGGIHPTILPDDCTNYADYVCIGEGYEPLYGLLRSLSAEERFPEVAGICYRRDNEVVYNKVSTPISDVDTLPFMDYGIKDHYIRKGDSIVPMTSSILLKQLGYWYTSFFTHGCPFSCSFCCNSVFHKLSPEYRKIRKHSPEYIAEEISFVRKMHPFIKMVKFNDDCIMSLTEQEMERFADLQAKQDKTPFVATGMNPALVTENKVEILVRAGLKRARIGIQTGSEKISKEIYNRRTVKEHIIRSSEILSKYSKQLVPTSYDVILDNPWEKPEDVLDTFNLVCQLKRPFVLNMYSLTFYPNTEIFRNAKQCGIIDLTGDSLGYSKSYLSWANNYLNCLIALEGIIPLSQPMQKRLLGKEMWKKNPPVPKLLRNLINSLTIAKKAYLHISRKDVTMMPHFIARFLN